VAKGHWAHRPGSGWFALVIAASIQLYERLKISFSFSDALERVHRPLVYKTLIRLYMLC
jgi:hypothetical protein